MNDEKFNHTYRIASARAPWHDYNGGAYFITICTQNHEHFFGEIENGEMHLSAVGRHANECIGRIAEHHPYAQIPLYVVMPNHIHLIVMISEPDTRQAIQESPRKGRSILSKVVGYIKMNASKAIRRQYGDVTVWQRGYHDHVIRNRDDYEMIAKYIHENPLRWKLDKFYTE